MTKNTNGRTSTGALPPIILGANDYIRLSAIANAPRASATYEGTFLARELDRARVLPDESVPLDVVAMGTHVEFRQNGNDVVNGVTLVYPYQADIAESRVSVLTPIGVALVGMGVGDSIAWQTRHGESRHLTVLGVGRQTGA